MNNRLTARAAILLPALMLPALTGCQATPAAPAGALVAHVTANFES